MNPSMELRKPSLASKVLRCANEFSETLHLQGFVGILLTCYQLDSLEFSSSFQRKLKSIYGMAIVFEYKFSLLQENSKLYSYE